MNNVDVKIVNLLLFSLMKGTNKGEKVKETLTGLKKLVLLREDLVRFKKNKEELWEKY